MQYFASVQDFSDFNAISLETLQIPWYFSIFLVLVSFDLECSWKLETCSVWVLVYKDSKFWLFKTKQCTHKGVERGFFQKKIKIHKNAYFIFQVRFCIILIRIWVLKSPQMYPWGPTWRFVPQVCPMVFKLRSGGFSSW